MSIDYTEIPIFPLYTVLYPEMILPLHIFEERYLDMINTCLRKYRKFGVVLIQFGKEHNADMKTGLHSLAGPYSIPYSVGTVARISHCESQSNGTMNVIVTGDARFKIREISNKNAYQTAKVQIFTDKPDDTEELDTLYNEANDLFREYVHSMYILANRHISSIHLPEDPANLSFAIANALQIPLSEKQCLLEFNNTQDRLRYEIDILKNEIEAQRYLKQIHKSLANHRSTEIVSVCYDSFKPIISNN